MGRMRIEIALIVGIVFFCCWCIYIIIKMNSSVSLSSQSLVTRDTSTADSYLLRQHAASSPISQQIMNPNNESYMGPARLPQQQQPLGYPAANQQQQQQQQQAPMRHQSQAPNRQSQRQHDSPAHSFSGWPTARFPANAATIADHIGGASTWRDYSSVSALQQPAAVAQQQHRWRPQINFQHTQQQQLQQQQQPMFSPDSQVIRASNFTPNRYFRPAVGQHASQIDWRPVNSVHPYKNNNNNNVYGQRLVDQQDLNPDPDSEHESGDAQVDQNVNEDGGGGGGEQAASDDDSPTIAGNTESPEEEEPDNVNRELEEQIGSRSFSEDDNESNERDKNGNLIISHRKHLINGKPVRDGDQRSSGKRKRKQVKVDFDKLVNEIEGDEHENEFDDGPDNEKQRQPVRKLSAQQRQRQQQQQTGESRPRKTIQSVNMSPRRIGDSIAEPHNSNSTKESDSRLNDAGKTVRTKNRRERVVNSELRSPKAGERELHEHRLHESLTAQQWDDDAAIAPTKKNTSLSSLNITSTPAGNSSQSSKLDSEDEVSRPETSGEEGKEGNDGQEEAGAEKVEEDDDPSGPQQVEAELKEMDMFADPEQFMNEDSEDESRRRRKRQVHEVELAMPSLTLIQQPVQADWKIMEQVTNNGNMSSNTSTKLLAGQLVGSDNEKKLDTKLIRLIGSPERAASEDNNTATYPKQQLNEPHFVGAELISNFDGNKMEEEEEEDDDDDGDNARENGQDQTAIASELALKVFGEQKLKDSAESSNEPKFIGIDGPGFNGSSQASLRSEPSFMADDSMKASESKRGLQTSEPVEVFDGANINKDNNNRSYEMHTNNRTKAEIKLGLGGFDSVDGRFVSATSQSGSLSEIYESPSAGQTALSDVSAAPTEAVHRPRQELDAIERQENARRDAEQQPEIKRKKEMVQVDEEVVSGEEDMSSGTLAQAPYLMSTEPPALNASSVQYSDVPQAPSMMASRPQRELGRQFTDTYPLAPPDDEQAPQSQEAQLPYFSHLRETSPPPPYYDPNTNDGHSAELANQAASLKQPDEPPLEAYHGIGGLQVQPLERPAAPPNGLAYLSDGASNGLFGGVGMTDDGNGNHLASASKIMKKNKMTMQKKKKKKKKFNKSMMSDSKLEKAKAISMKKKSKFKKGKMKKKKKNFKDKAYKIDKEFKGDKKGKKGKKGHGEKGANKGALFYKDKGYKKRGFKKAYKKLEEGDHKTYFDEFRDKDHNKKWKHFKDKHHYNQKKNWTGKDRKKFKNYHENFLKDKKEKEAAWREKAASKHKKVHKYRGDSSRFSKKKKVKKESLKKKSKDYI